MYVYVCIGLAKKFIRFFLEDGTAIYISQLLCRTPET